MALSTSIIGKYVTTVDATGGIITATFSNATGFEANAKINASTLVFSAVTHAGSISWACKGSTGIYANAVANKYKPQVCRS